MNERVNTLATATGHKGITWWADEWVTVKVVMMDASWVVLMAGQLDA